MYIESSLYQKIIDCSVNLCVDIFLEKDGKYLLIKRTQEPVKGVYWPIGGRIHKGETAEQAARRKIKEEVGIDYHYDLTSIGYYEDQYSANSFRTDTHYHTLSIVFLGKINDLNIKLDKTSEEWGFFQNFPERFVIKKFSQ